MFSRARHWLHVFPRLALVTCFAALGTGYKVSRAWHGLHVFPRLALVTCLPALGTGYKVTRAWHGLHVPPCLTPVPFFLHLAQEPRFAALGTGNMRFRA